MSDERSNLQGLSGGSRDAHDEVGAIQLKKTTSRRGMISASIAGAGGLGLFGMAGSAHADGRSGEPFVLKDRVAINVKDYGAVGDGETDDLAAIQAAIDDAGPPVVGDPAVIGAHEPARSVFFPVGKYAVSATVNVMSSNRYLVGESVGAKLVRHETNHDPYILAFVGIPGDPPGERLARTFLHRVGIRNLGLGEGIKDNDYEGDPLGGLLIHNAAEFEVDGCNINGHHGPGLTLIDAFIGNIVQNNIRNCTDDGIKCIGVCNALRMSDNRIQANLGVGIRLPTAQFGDTGLPPRANGIHIAGNDVEGNGLEAILLSNATNGYRGVNITGNYFELSYHPSYTEGGGPHIRKTEDPVRCIGLSIVGNSFSPVQGGGPAVIIEEGTDGILAGNGFNPSGLEDPTDSYEFGEGADHWIINQGSSALELIGDARITDPANGVILTSPNGNEHRVRVDDAGAVFTEAVA